jgi:hypothetical protein
MIILANIDKLLLIYFKGVLDVHLELRLTFAAWRSGGLAFRPPNQLLIIDSNVHCDYVQVLVNVQLELMFRNIWSAHWH